MWVQMQCRYSFFLGGLWYIINRSFAFSSKKRTFFTWNYRIFLQQEFNNFSAWGHKIQLKICIYILLKTENDRPEGFCINIVWAVFRSVSQSLYAKAVYSLQLQTLRGYCSHLSLLWLTVLILTHNCGFPVWFFPFSLPHPSLQNLWSCVNREEQYVDALNILISHHQNWSCFGM